MNTNKLKIRYSGERLSLAVSIILLVLISLLVLQISFWFLILLVFAQLAYVVVKQKQLVGNSLIVGGSQFQDINNIVIENSISLGIKKPNVYISQDPYLNAYTLGFKSPFSVVLTSSLVESFSRDELDFVIAHEMGHIKYGHATMLSLVSPLGSGIPVMSLIYGDWQRRTEYTADRSGLVSIPKLSGAINALIKLAVGGKLSKLANVEAITNQVYKQNNGLISQLGELFLNHPYTTNRIAELVEFSKQLPQQ